MAPSLLEIIISTIVSSHCISMCIIALLRYNNIKAKKESIIFCILCIATAFWALSGIISKYFSSYGWVTSIIVVDTAIIYMLIITSSRLYKFFILIALICTAGVFITLFIHNPISISYRITFAIFLFPLVIMMNTIIYVYYIKHKTKFHFSLALIATLMILGGFYDTFKEPFNWPLIPLGTISCFGFILIIGYHLLGRGYLQQQGWSDYVVEHKEKEVLLKEKYILLKKANLDSIIALSQTIEANDSYTRGHCLRVRNFAKVLGEKIGFDKERLFFLELGALLHDIGKIGIPTNILNKEGHLTKEEFDIIKKHPIIGASIVNNIDFYKPIVPMILHHHEHYDGKGYPTGLKRNEIPLEARILTVADAYDAMTSKRPYRDAFSIDKALNILNEISGSQLDPDLVEIFIISKIYKIVHNISEKIAIDF